MSKFILFILSNLLITYGVSTCQPYSETLSSRVVTLINQMSLEEKVGQMTQINTGSMLDKATGKLDPKLIEYYVNERKVGSFLNTLYEKLDSPPPTKEVWVETINDLQSKYQKNQLKIPMVFGLDSVHGANYIHGATLFPQQLGLAATFNRTAARVAAEITAKDTRAIGIHWNFSPILDIAVNKQWPRVYETFGEDPYLVSEMGAEMILGYQGCNELHRGDKVAATMKHFIGYSATRSGMDVDGSWMGDRVLNDYFRPSFQKAVEVGVATAMESYSDIDGDHLVNSKKLLVDLLRNDMKFKGSLVTDWEQINKLKDKIHIASTVKEAVKLSMQLGSVDMSMVPNDGEFIDHLISLVKSGDISMKLIDQSVGRILNLKEKLGLLDSDGTVNYNSSLLASIGNDGKISLDAARESVILLQNNQNTLPLTKNKNILITGPVSDSLSYLTGGWTHRWQGPLNDGFFQGKGTTILQGLHKHTQGKITHLPGVDIFGNSTTDINEIIHAAQYHDVIVVCLGEQPYAEVKGNIHDMHLPKGQLNLMDNLIEKSGKPVIIILSQGRPRVTNPTIKKADAVLASFLVGPYGGDAISEILFGITNPSGKLPITYANQANDNNLNYYHRFNELFEDVYWEFGHGLSYTTFTYTNLQLSSPIITATSTITATVTVTNTGARAGSETILFYITDEYRTIAPEVKKLRYFTKIHLLPSQSQSITFTITNQDLAFHNSQYRRVAEVGNFTLQVQHLKSTFTLQHDQPQFSVPF